jgi:hypothetical protein
MTHKLIELKDRITKNIAVSAKSCLWFTWADEGLDGPEGETVNDVYRPHAINISGIRRFIVRAIGPNDQWWHHPGKVSGAEGIDDSRNLENENYKSAQYNSQKIRKLKARLNLLVGLVGRDTAPASEVDQEPIGLEREITVNDAADNRLFLGFHDGRHWTNNGGSGVNVEIEIIENWP